MKSDAHIHALCTGCAKAIELGGDTLCDDCATEVEEEFGGCYYCDLCRYLGDNLRPYCERCYGEWEEYESEV